MTRLAFLTSATILTVVVAAGAWLVGRRVPTLPQTPGVSRALARDRETRVSGLRYDVDLRVPAARTEAVRGTIAASFDLASATLPLVFDFAQPSDRLVSATANGRTFAARVEDGHVIVPTTHLNRGRNKIQFEFAAGDTALNRQDDFLYSLFVPARASLTFPCFDQPNLKARWRLSLDVPADWTAVSNGQQTGRTVGGGRARYAFDETPPISSYLFAFTAGRFSTETRNLPGRTLRLLHRETDQAKLARNLDAIFDLHAHALDWLERYTGIAYPFGKFDFVLIPAFQFGGMEHPGAVFYNANGLLLDEAATEQQVLARANVISHEVAHMWFGDLVTMTWFDDVWMKEVFANYLAAKMVNPSFPAMNHDLRFFVQHYPVAYDVDRTAGANPIRQELENLSDAGSLYGAIIYQKAPIVMRQLEALVGESLFQQGLREYLVQHGFSNAGWPELVEVLDRLTPYDLNAWSRSWISEAGRPTIATDLSVANGRVTRLTLRQTDPHARGITWTQPLRVSVGHGVAVRTFDVTMDGPSVDVAGAVGLEAPDWILPAGDGRGYGAFQVDATTLGFLGPRAHTIADPVRRGAAFLVRWENMLEGRLPTTVVREGLLESVASETVELNLQILLDEMRALFWRFTPADERAAFAGRLEPLLRRGLQSATTTSARAAWFTTLRSVATTANTLGWLEDVWAHRTRIAGLPLAEVDESEMALELALRDVPSAAAILNTELKRITNADRRARFSFIMPAVSADAAVRRAFFEGLREPQNRTREAWVLDAARYLHHPLRNATSTPLVTPALDMVWEIQRTGDIFFPKRWADATLSGYQSSAVAAAVRAFIDQLPADYPPRLRWVLLASSDPLFRAARLIDGAR